MATAQEIVNYARSLFDVVSIGQLSSENKVLLAGLESTPERNIDEFAWENERFFNYGFEKHINPKLEAILKFIRNEGFEATAIGKYGYPSSNQLNLKTEAIHTGLGRRGKSTVVINDRYGTRLRFAAISTNAPLQPLVSPQLPDEESPFCHDCKVCIDICPADALHPYKMPDTSVCLSNHSKMPQHKGRYIPCDLCLIRCPANGGG
jgi:epoxyqueuosine reductase QueG